MNRKLNVVWMSTAVAITTALCCHGAAQAGEPCEPAWHALSSGGQVGLNGNVWVTTVWNGDLIAGGEFTTAGGQTVNRIARWDGSAWHPFVSGGQVGVNGMVQALAEWNGDLIVGGSFSTAGGQETGRVARWDGTAWHPIGGLGAQWVRALAVWNGDLYVGGNITQVAIPGDFMQVNHITRWDGSAWHQLGSSGQVGLSNWVWALTEWNGDLVAGGAFTLAGGHTFVVNAVVRWDGSTWHPFESGGQIGVNGGVENFSVLPNGDLVAGGNILTAGGQTMNYVARWDGLEWHPFTSGGEVGVNGAVWAQAVLNSDLVVGGAFTTAGGQTVNRIARWDGAEWHPFTSDGQVGVNNEVWDMTVYNGDLIAGGAFTTAGGQTVNHIARWDGCAKPCAPADLNCDGSVGVPDLLILLANWGECPPDPDECPADLDESGTVGVPDLLILLANWG